jgi:glycosyltransferase involved in cell wall biosynthesis
VGYRVGLIPIDEFVAGSVEADLYIVERLLWNGCDPVRFDGMPDGPAKRRLLYAANLKVLDRIAEVQSRGAKVAAIFDDHYEAYPRDTELDPMRGGASLWLDGMMDGVDVGFRPMEDFRHGLGMVDAIFSPSPFLLHYYAPDSPKAHVVHNRPLLDMWQDQQSALPEDRVRIGWSGTAAHVVSWRDHPALDALGRLKDKIVVIGATSSNEIISLLKGRGVEYRNAGTVSFERFPDVVYGYDIGISPLQGEFDKGRSWIKWLECSLAGKPVVASDHAGVYKMCEGGYQVRDAYEWHAALEHLIEDYTTRHLLSAAGRSWAWQQGWDQNLSELTDAFEAILHD